MKKIKLLLAAIAAMVGLSASAQSWTAPTIQGDDPVAGTQYKVMNVGAGTFLDMGKAWFNWSTTAILSSTGTNFTMTADGNNWKFIRTGSQGVFTSGNEIPGDAMHVDNTADTYGITKLPNGHYHIHDVGGDDNSNCWGYEFIKKTGGQASNDSWGVVAHADAATIGNYGEWVFIQPANVEAATSLYLARLSLYQEYLKAYEEGANTDDAAEVYNNESATIAQLNEATTALHQTRIDYRISLATVSNPQDLTEFFVVNPDFSTFDGTGWTRTQTSVGNQQFGTGAMESWNNNNVSVTQELTGLPNGKFRVSCDMIAGNDKRTAYVYAKGMAEVEGEHVNAQSSAGDYTTMSNEVAGNTISAYPVLVDNHTMTIGFKDPSGWVVVDNFKIIYYGPDLDALKEALQANIDAVAALEGTTTTATYTAAKNYADNINLEALETEEAITSVSAELTDLLNTAKALQASYAEYKRIKAAILAINDDIDLAATTNAVENATTVNVIESQTASARTALKTYFGSVENEEIDLTAALLSNPGFELGNLNGWTNSGEINAQAQGNKAFDNTQGNFYAERWHVNGTVDLNQTLTDMPAGYYQLSAYIYSEPADGKLYANSTDISVSTSKLYTVPFKLEENGDITFGASCTLTGSTWFCMDGFALKFLGTAPLSHYQSLLADAATAAEGHATALNGKIPTAALTAYNNAINDAKAKNTTIDACLAGLDDLTAATATADALVSPYAAYLLIKTSVEALNDATIYTGEATLDLSAEAAAEKATTAEGIASAATSLKEAATTFVTSVTVNEGKFFDMTNLWIVNPTVSQNVEGWKSENVVRAVSWGTGPTTNYDETEFYQSTFDFYQEVTLPRGTFEFGVTGFHRAGNHNTHFYAGEDKILIHGVSDQVVNTMAQAKTYFDEGNGKVALKFGLEDESNTIKIGILNQDTETDRWTIFRNFTLHYYGTTVDYSIYVSQWEEAKTAAETAKTAHSTITFGDEYIALNAAIADAPDGTSKANYLAKIEALQAATSAFITAAPSNEAIYDAYQEALNTAKAINDPMNANVSAALNDAIETNVDMTNKEAIQNATANLNTAVDNAEASIANYVEALAIINAADDYDEAGQNSYLNSDVISDLSAIYANGELDAVSNDQKAAAQAALATACKAQIQPKDGCDMTPFIVNPGIDGNADGWTCDINANGGYVGGPLKPSNDAMEFWGQYTLDEKAAGKSFDYYQVLSGLPDGAYTISADMLNSTNGEEGASWDGGGKAGLYGKTATNEVQALVTTDGETFLPYTTNEIFVIDGELRIGVKNIAALTGRWFACDNFKLTYARQLTDDEKEAIAAEQLATAKAAYDAALAAASAAKENANYANVTGNELTSLINAINDVPEENKASYEAKTAALTAATTAFTAAALYYNLYVSELTIAQAISNTITVEAPTTADEALAAFKSLKVDEYNYVSLEYPYSATSKIGDFTSWERSGSVNGNTDVTFIALTEQHWSGKALTYYEQPNGGWSTVGATFTAKYEKVCTLPAGSYVVKVAARAASGTNTTAKITCSAATMDGPIPNLGDTGKGITTAGVASFDEGEFANGGTGRGFVWNYLPFTLTEETEVTMTVIAEADGIRQWFSVCDGELLSKTNIATAVAYDEATSNTIEDVDVANVTMTRTIKEGYNTIVLPFDLTSSQVQTAFGTGTEVFTYYENSENDMDATIYFNKDVAGTISANVPVLISATAASTKQTFEGVQVVAPTDDIKVAGKNFDFVGTYDPIAAIEAGDWFIGNGAVYKSKGTTSMKAFRAYLDNKTGAEVKMFIGGIETAISEINDDASINGTVYNLAGQRVNKAQKGLYIVNGKKVIIK